MALSLATNITKELATLRIYVLTPTCESIVYYSILTHVPNCLSLGCFNWLLNSLSIFYFITDVSKKKKKKRDQSKKSHKLYPTALFISFGRPVEYHIYLYTHNSYRSCKCVSKLLKLLYMQECLNHKVAAIIWFGRLTQTIREEKQNTSGVLGTVN